MPGDTVTRSIFTSPVTFDFASALAELQSLGTESSRVEFKEQFETSKPKIVRAACSLANAFGGIVAIGFKDPERNGGRIELAEPPYEVSEKTTTSIVNSVLSNTYPSVESTCHAFVDGASRRGFYLLRVPESEYAPHSLTVDNSFPVRRHNLTGTLSLSEIEGMIRRRDGVPAQSEYRSGPSYLSIMRSPSPTAPNFLGIALEPGTPLRVPRRLDADENVRVLSFFPASLKMRDLSLQSGIIFCDVEDPTHQNYHTGTKLLHLDAHGDVVMRFLESTETEWYQFIYFLGVAYRFGSALWSTWGVGPVARVQLELDLQRQRLATSLGQLPQVHSDFFPVDFSAQSFSEAFLDAVVRTERVAGRRGYTKEAKRDLEYVWGNDFGGLDLRSRWNRL